MKLTTLFTGAAALCLASLTTPAAADGHAPVCGLGTGEAATGEPIKVGGINGNAPPGDFSGGTDAAAAYFACVNDNGGINGRPIEYLVENDQCSYHVTGRCLFLRLIVCNTHNRQNVVQI